MASTRDRVSGPLGEVRPQQRHPIAALLQHRAEALDLEAQAEAALRLDGALELAAPQLRQIHEAILGGVERGQRLGGLRVVGLLVDERAPDVDGERAIAEPLLGQRGGGAAEGAGRLGAER